MYYDVDENCKSVLYSSNSSGIPQLYLIPTDVGSKPRQITNGTDPVIFGYISPKGDKLIYLRDKDGNEIDQIFLLSVERGGIKQLTDTPYRTLGLGWHPNGKEFSRIIITQKGFILETINVESGETFVLKESIPLLEGIIYSHDGKWIASTADISATNEQIYIINRNNPEDTIVYSIKDNSRENLPSWSPNDKKLAFRSEATGQGRIFIQEFQGEDQFILDINEDEEVSSYNFSYSNNPVWNSKSETVYYIVSKYGRQTLHAHPLVGEKEPALPFPEGVVAMPKISKDGRFIVATHSSMTSPEGIYIHEFGSETVVPLTPREFNIDLSLLNKPQSIWYKSFDARSIHSWYISAVDTPEPYPAVIRVHGGPWAQYSDAWGASVLSHCLSQSGIACFLPNFRGSTGYGSEFQNLDIGDLGGGDLEDIIYGADWLRTKSEIDKTKIAITGLSYGGFMTLLALTKKPDAFITGVSLVPITDWSEMYYLSDPAFQQFEKDLFGGTPEQKKDLYEDRSPITHISNIKAPVMIMAGKNDSRCPIEPIEKFIKKLKEKNHPHEFIIQENAGHISALFNWEESVPLFTKMVDFLKRNLI